MGEMIMIDDRAKELLKEIGGQENIDNLTHCATRLRFELKDNDNANKEVIKEKDYVLSVVESGGQFQVVIGPDVSKYYVAIQNLLDSNTNPITEDEVDDKRKDKNFSIFGFISGAFTPLIPLLAGAGMVKAVITLLVQLNLLVEGSQTFNILSAAGNSVFYFLPVFLGFTLANLFKANPFVGAAIGASLLEPAYTGLIGTDSVHFMGIPVTAIDYASSVFPIFIAVTVYAFIDKQLRRIIHENLQLFLVPMLSLIIIVPLTVIVFGPFGTTLGTMLSDVILWLYNLNRAVAGFIFAGAYPFITMLGLHWAFTPITLNNLATYGTDVIEGIAVASIWAQIGIAIGIVCKSKSQSKARKVSTPTVLTGVIAGVTEPILYGLIMQYKRLPIVVAIAGGIGGAINGLLGVGMDAYVFHHVWSIITGAYSPLGSFLIGSMTALVVGFILTMTWGIKKEDMKDFV